jgi:hypothetical protein
MPETTKKTLKKRGSKYGTMESNAETTQELMEVFMRGKNAKELARIHLECIHMIFHKISRMVNGDVNYTDNMHDVAGYAKLLEDYQEKQNVNT